MLQAASLGLTVAGCGAVVSVDEHCDVEKDFRHSQCRVSAGGGYWSVQGKRAGKTAGGRVYSTALPRNGTWKDMDGFRPVARVSFCGCKPDEFRTFDLNSLRIAENKEIERFGVSVKS